MAISARVKFLVFLALAFIVVGSPATYKLTSKVFGAVKLRTADATGTPTNAGLVIHAGVLAALTYLFLKVTRESL